MLKNNVEKMLSLMTKNILAYFRTENDAESARSALQTLKVTI